MYAIGGRWCGTTNKTYQSNQREHIGQSIEQGCQIGIIGIQILQGDGKSATQPEYEASCSSPQGSIFAENHGGQGDKASTIRHTLVEDSRNTQRQVRACQT